MIYFYVEVSYCCPEVANSLPEVFCFYTEADRFYMDVYPYCVGNSRF